MVLLDSKNLRSPIEWIGWQAEKKRRDAETQRRRGNLLSLDRPLEFVLSPKIRRILRDVAVRDARFEPRRLRTLLALVTRSKRFSRSTTQLIFSAPLHLCASAFFFLPAGTGL